MIVMLAHYIISFSAFSGGYGGLPPIDGGVFTDTAEILGFGMASFSYGALGVALFFLVSGFVIPLSLTKLTKKKFGILAFAISRIIRIWPVYIVGFSISLIFRWFSFHNSSISDGYTMLDVLSHITLFRDWIGGIPLDGVAWTLEIEIKFYLISTIFAYATVNGKQYITLFSIFMAFIGYYLKNNPESYFVLPIGVLNCFQFIVFMTIGTNLFLLYSGVISRNKASIWILASLLSFIYVTPSENKVGYVIAFLVFLSCYIGRDSFTGGAITSFFAKISYPMYVTHALFGYVTMWYMISIGINQYIALIIQVAITIYLSYLIHKYVEVKSQQIGKRASEIITGDIKMESHKSRSMS